MIRVGRRKYGCGDPSYPNFKQIICMTKSTAYGELSPYCLKNEKGQILENVWQFSKLYDHVPYSRQTYSRYDSRVIWEHKAERHVNDTGSPTQDYWRWRERGMNASDPIRYPVGFRHRTHVRTALHKIGENEYLELDYIDARKEIYLPLYLNAVKKEAKFARLKRMLKEGQNLLIIEVDGPHQESMFYYQQKYGVNDDFIVNDTMLASEENLHIMLNDDKHPFGHGYCLAWALLLDL
uniref:Uncharacterized protein n=1 Tax=viral metagenome TaxID=1070528 RepID=A0A6C0EK58_9ZZZZ